MTAPAFAADAAPAPTPPPAAPSPADSPAPAARTGAARVSLIADVIAVALIVAAVALMIAPWSGIFADLGFAVPMIGVSFVIALTVAVVSRRGWSTPTSFLASAAVTVVGIGAFHGGDIGDLPSNLIQGWKALASTGLLIPTDAALVIPPVVIAALGTWVAAEAIVRRRLSAPGVLGLLGAHAAVASYTISQWQPMWWFAAAIAAILCSLLAVSGLTRPGGASFAKEQVQVSLRQVGSAAVVVGLLSVAAAGLMVLVEDRGEDRAFDLRSALTRPLDISETATPLARVKAGLIDEDNNTVFTVGVDGLGPDETIGLIPVAVLDRYDGTIWSTSARFEAAGSTLPAPALANPSSGQVAVQVELTDQYPFRFLPQVGVLQTITDGDLAWDPVTGTVASIDAAGTSYEGRASVITAAELPSQLGDNETSLDGASRRADLTDEQRNALNAYLTEVVGAEDDPFDQLRAIEADLLSDRFGYNEASPAGHSLAAITSYLQPNEEEDGAAGRVGFSEHAAASFAILARELGVPSRVVVGYLLEEPVTASAPEQIVSENMIHAWPEVWVDGTGWVRMDVTNKINQSPDEPSRTPAVSAAGVEANATDLPDIEQPVILPDEQLDSGASVPWWVFALAALPFLYGAVVIGGKALRRLARKRRPTDGRIIGAWQETQDRFAELGLPSSPSLSALDVAEELDVIDLRDVGDPVVALAPTLDIALYSPYPASDADADQAWAAAGAAIKQARHAVPYTAKVKAALNPRSLLRR